jgi:hypothetical protein
MTLTCSSAARFYWRSAAGLALALGNATISSLRFGEQVAE